MIEARELESLLGKKLVDFEISSDFIELIFENGRLIIELLEDNQVYFLGVRVVP